MLVLNLDMSLLSLSWWLSSLSLSWWLCSSSFWFWFWLWLWLCCESECDCDPGLWFADVAVAAAVVVGGDGGWVFLVDYVVEYVLERIFRFISMLLLRMWNVCRLYGLLSNASAPGLLRSSWSGSAFWAQSLTSPMCQIQTSSFARQFWILRCLEASMSKLPKAWCYTVTHPLV